MKDTNKQFIINFTKFAKFPILSHRYNTNVYKTYEDDLPKRAYALIKLRNKLQSKFDIQWQICYKLSMSKEYCGIRSGHQLIGKYKDKYVIIESKVGVSNNSAGYFAGYCDINNISSLRSTVHISTRAVLEWLIKKIKKLFCQL